MGKSLSLGFLAGSDRQLCDYHGDHNDLRIQGFLSFVSHKENKWDGTILVTRIPVTETEL